MMPDITELLSIRYPIIQAPMLGVTTPDMVAAVSNAGALGSLPLGGVSPDKARALIRATKEKTDRPFAVNLFTHGPAANIPFETIDRMQDFIAERCAEHHLPFERQNPVDFVFHYYEALIPVLLEERIPIVSFTFGNLTPDIIHALKQQDTLLIGTATSPEEAIELEKTGSDLITVQGIEAGGHRGSFLPGQALPQIDLLSLLSQTTAAVSTPAIAAGAIHDQATMQAAFSRGACAVQIGSLFIPADESAACAAYKNAVLQAEENTTALTRAFSGRWARGIENDFMRWMAQSGLEIPYYTFQNQLTGPMRAYAQQHNLREFLSLWAGQAAGKSTAGSSHEIITRLIQMLPV